MIKYMEKNKRGLIIALSNDFKFYSMARAAIPLKPERAIRLALEFMPIINDHLANNPLEIQDIAECVIDAYNYCLDGGNGVDKLTKGVQL